jgi:hypothetical protein
VLRGRLIPLVPLLALFAFVATTEERAEAVDEATRVEGENFTSKPAGTTIVTDTTLYSNDQALKFTQPATASHTVDCSAVCDVQLTARGGQSGGSPTLKVNGAPAQAITNSGAVQPYTFDVNLPAGQNNIDVTAANTGTGRNLFLDFATFPASGSGGTDTDMDGVPEPPDNCPDVYNPGQRDDDGDGVGNKCDDGSTTPTWNCTGNQITPGEDIDAIINNDASGTATRFCVHAGTYQVSAQATLKAGDKLEGEPGTKTTVDTATKPTPKVKLVASGSDNLLRADGNGISITWVDLSGARGTGNGSGAIAAGSAGSDFLVQFARIHDNASLGISNMKGRILDSEFFSNSESSASLGLNASAVKGITEFEAGRVYVHDEQGNGLWCDVGCSNDPARANGFWVYNSVVVDSNRAGIRYENSPNQALFENNEVHGNGKTEWRGGIDIRDSQNARVVNNNLGTATIAGVKYQVNGNQIGVRATDSGRSDRVNLSNIKVETNNFGLVNIVDRDRIVTCGGQVACSGNTNVGSH